MHSLQVYDQWSIKITFSWNSYFAPLKHLGNSNLFINGFEQLNPWQIDYSIVYFYN